MFQNERVYVISDYRKNGRITALQRMLTSMETHLRRMQYDQAEMGINQIFEHLCTGEEAYTPQVFFHAGSHQ